MKPYLSIILSGRNDNYGGDFLKRLQDFFDWNVALFESYKVDTEIILVNWNPLENEASIEELIQFQKNRKYVCIRIITVPNVLHETFVNSEIRRTVPLFEFIAKNVGIRRAKGEFILSLNADLLVHPKIVESIAKKNLSSNFYYRANRLDFTSIDKIVGINQLYNRGVFVSLKGFKYSLNSTIPKKFQLLVLTKFNQIRLMYELFKKKYQKLSNLLGLSITFDNAEYHAHCLNSGDFMLMHRSNWLNLNGYPETTFVSTHTDSLFTIFAHSKLKEFIFKKPIFHQEHERRYTSKIIDNDSEIYQEYRNFQKISQSILLNNDCKSFLNTNDWGMEGYNLEEIIVE